MEAYHGYWPNDLYSINSHFGTPDDLRALSTALHGRGMVSPPAAMSTHETDKKKK